jgi:D-arabinose 1-dehydrogenase-like Zn-dependent alcohol dehydrogenase
MNDYDPEPGLASIATTIYALNFGDAGLRGGDLVAIQGIGGLGHLGI